MARRHMDAHPTPCFPKYAPFALQRDEIFEPPRYTSPFARPMGLALGIGFALLVSFSVSSAAFLDVGELNGRGVPLENVVRTPMIR